MVVVVEGWLVGFFPNFFCFEGGEGDGEGDWELFEKILVPFLKWSFDTEVVVLCVGLCDSLAF